MGDVVAEVRKIVKECAANARVEGCLVSSSSAPSLGAPKPTKWRFTIHFRRAESEYIETALRRIDTQAPLGYQMPDEPTRGLTTVEFDLELG